ncbi:hypothetical protein LJB42_000179 [Komagataella kurtzmanii]|nr:hypothetical protein LJB42_000179 [Komagataella kurtzmanii]
MDKLEEYVAKWHSSKPLESREIDVGGTKGIVTKLDNNSILLVLLGDIIETRIINASLITNEPIPKSTEDPKPAEQTQTGESSFSRLRETNPISPPLGEAPPQFTDEYQLLDDPVTSNFRPPSGPPPIGEGDRLPPGGAHPSLSPFASDLQTEGHGMHPSLNHPIFNPNERQPNLRHPPGSRYDDPTPFGLPGGTPQGKGPPGGGSSGFGGFL